MGNATSFVPLLFPPPKPRWSAQDVPDMSGKVVIITGGNAGIGKENAKAALERNAKVYLACRSRSKAHEAIKELAGLYPDNMPLFLELDLANLASVRKSAEEFLSKEKELHVLFNNGGVMSCPVDWVTSDNYDMQFGTNVIGHWFFTELLMPALLSAYTATGEKSRVVTVASSGAYLMAKFDYSTLVDSPARRKLSAKALYYQSKFGNVVVARELARRHGDKIVSISLHPGNINSELQRHQASFENWVVEKLFLYPVAPYGALTQLYAGTAPEAEAHNGKYLIPWARVGTPPLRAHDSDVGAQLWQWLEEQTRGR